MKNMQEVVIPSPVPLVQYGQYSSDAPEPTWKVKSFQPISESAGLHGRVLYAADIVYPAESRRVYMAYEVKDEEELRAYAKFLLTGGTAPCFLEHYSPYPKASLLASSLTPSRILKFNSHFEGGNLSRAYALSDTEYDLYMTVDTNTKGHTQWFSFSVENTLAGNSVRFNIVNFTKGSSLLRSGLKPSFLSITEKKRTGMKWSRVETAVTYQRNNYERPGWRRSVPIDTEEDDDEIVTKYQKGVCKKHYYYTFSFEHRFMHSEDTVFFAFAVPYPCSRLHRFLQRKATAYAALEIDPGAILFKKEELCSTVLGLPVHLVTITAGRNTGLPIVKRKGVVITARVHPGETVGSIIMERVISYLLSSSREAEALRSLYVFKLVPMLNPDGVVLGNYRSCVSGEDLNRRWEHPISPEHNPILYTKRMMEKFRKERDIVMFCDLHGHSKKHNSFIYGCNTAPHEGFASWTKVRLFPRVFARRTPLFSYKDCRFRIEPDKLGTGRVVVWKELGITNSFTLETSFHGASCAGEIKKYGVTELEELAGELLQSLLEYTSLLRQIEKEMYLNHGWLKPSRLKELTGTPAQEVLEREMERHRKDYKTRDLRRTTQAAGKRGNQPHTGKLDSAIIGKDWGRILAPVVEKRDWREYFTPEEIQEAFIRFSAGIDLADPDSSGSDSCPSEDNLELSESSPVKRDEETQLSTVTDGHQQVMVEGTSTERHTRGKNTVTTPVGEAPGAVSTKSHVRTVSQPLISPVEQYRPMQRRKNASVINRTKIHEYSGNNLTATQVDSESDLENTSSLSPTKPGFQTYQSDEAYGSTTDYARNTKGRMSLGLNVTGSGAERLHQDSRMRGSAYMSDSYMTAEPIRRVSVGSERSRSKASQRGSEADGHSNKLVLKAVSKPANGKLYYLRRPANILLPEVRKVFIPSYQSLEIRSAKYELRHSSHGRRSTSPQDGRR